MRKQADYCVDEIIKDYLEDVLSVPKIALKQNVHSQTIYDILKRFKIPPKRYDNRKNIFNYHYFDDINSIDKAYFLGWLYSDGNNYPETHTITLTLKATDFNILKILSSYISEDLNYPIKIINRSDGSSKACLRFSSKHTSETLIKKGVVKNKTFVLEFPDETILPKELIHHFIRGYFDGDGCITRSNNKNKSFILSGRYEFLIPCQEILIKELNINKTKLIKNKSIYNLCIGGNNQINKVKNYLYKDCKDLYLQRKFDKINL